MHYVYYPRLPASQEAGVYSTVSSAPISVPEVPQTFDTELGPQYGLQYEFHYSQFTGRRKVARFPSAVLNVGTTYRNPLLLSADSSFRLH
jgi:hypothetical protein